MTHDIIIIGAGPGGYIAAERAGAQEKKVLLIEKSALGGVCLNEGCIPTKTLLNSAKLYAHGMHAAQFGVSFDNPRFDLTAAMAHKKTVMDKLRAGIAYLMKKYAVEVVTGSASFVDKNTVAVDGKDYSAPNIIIASGSEAFVPPIPGVKDNPRVMTNREILSIAEMPKSLVVVGGGVIGVEFATFFSTFGVKVDIVEMLPEIVPFMDTEIAPLLRKELKHVSFHLSAKVENVSGGTVEFTKDGKKESITADIILMAVGRRPNVAGLGLEKIGVDFDGKGIKVNEKMQTNVPGIYAIGDATGKWLLAHTASRMGEVAVNVIAGKNDRMRYNAVPWALYGMPEAAGCGMTEDEAKKNNVPYMKSSMQLRVNGRFLAENGSAGGICKVIAHKESGVILGVHMLGGACSEMIFGVAAMIESEIRINELKEIIFPHPSVSEIIRDVAFEMKI
ncbi:MAG: dihydrolipoyl dehydrogenase [Spirochaetota bacterium]